MNVKPVPSSVQNSILMAEKMGHRFSDQWLFRDFDLKVASGESIAILGPSGVGKSTLLQVLAGLIPSSEGRVKNTFSSHSFVFQDPRLLPWRTCLENTMLPLELGSSQIKKTVMKEKAELVLTSLGLSSAFDKFPHQLSGGMKMRCSLARSLVTDPPLLFLDEPFSALDEWTRQGLQEDLRRLFENKKCALIFVTHSLEEACFLSQKVVFLSKNLKSQVFPIHLPDNRNQHLRNETLFFQQVQSLREKTMKVSE